MLPKRKNIDRMQVLREIKKRIVASGKNQLEISLTELGHVFDIKQPSMKLHIDKLVEEQHLIEIQGIKTKYSRKVYALPDHVYEEEAGSVGTPSNMNPRFERLLKLRQQRAQEKKVEVFVSSPQENVTVEKEKVQNIVMDTNIMLNMMAAGAGKAVDDVSVLIKDKSQPIQEMGRSNRVGTFLEVEGPSDRAIVSTLVEKMADPESPVFVVEGTPGMGKTHMLALMDSDAVIDHPFPKSNQEQQQLNQEYDDLLNFKELTLDEQVQQYLEKQNKVPNAEFMLAQRDKEIYSVMIETINQAMNYLQDTAQQLTTQTDKTLVLNLINRYQDDQATIKKQQEEIEMLKLQLSAYQQKERQVDPNRVRHYQAQLIDHAEQFIKQGNVQMSINRADYQKRHDQLVKEFTKYVLGLEEA